MLFCGATPTKIPPTTQLRGEGDRGNDLGFGFAGTHQFGLGGIGRSHHFTTVDSCQPDHEVVGKAEDDGATNELDVADANGFVEHVEATDVNHDLGGQIAGQGAHAQGSDIVENSIATHNQR